MPDTFTKGSALVQATIEAPNVETRKSVTTEHLASDGLSWVTVEELRAGHLVDFDFWNLTPDT